MNEPLNYGKIITTESFYDGSLKQTKREYSIPKIVTNRSQALSEIVDAIDLITTSKTSRIEIILEADPRTFKIKLITKKYVVNL